MARHSSGRPSLKGRDTQLLRKGFGHKRDEEVGKNPRLCDPWLFGGRRGQSDQALQTLEGELDAPAHAIELENCAGGKLVLVKRDHKVSMPLEFSPKVPK